MKVETVFACPQFAITDLETEQLINDNYNKLTC